MSSIASPSSNSTAISSQKYVSFLLEGDDQVPCEVCLEPFDPLHRLPKILPCGHNFCEHCLFSLCCHQQYYLLDSIKCPTCRRSFSSKIAINAPTNYDLCKLLENVKRGRDLNITVIRVSDSYSTASSSIASGSSSSSHIKFSNSNNPFDNTKPIPLKSDEQTVEKPHNQVLVNPSLLRKNGSVRLNRINSLRAKKPQHPKTSSIETGREPVKVEEEMNRCVDCRRKLGTEQRVKTSRFCERCHQHDKILRLSCLECCVNRHNGHPLRSICELEFDHQKLLNELKELHQRRFEASNRFDENLKVLDEENHIRIDCSALGRAKQTLMKESEKSYTKAISRLENRDTFPLPPEIISRIRHRQLHNYTRLQKLASLLEKCLKNVNNRFERHVAMMTKSLPKTISTISQKSTSSSLKTDETTAYSSLCTVLALTGETFPQCSIIQEHLPTILDPTYDDTQKIFALKSCIRILNNAVDSSISTEIVLLFEDAYLNCFYTLNPLSKRAPNSDERTQIWKMVQASFSELLRIASSHWPSSSPDRVDLVNDISYLCHLYSDVCDTATMALCMIEAARSRSVQDQVTNEEDKYRMDIQLKLIDEHLLECRRVQKLSELKSGTKILRPPGKCNKIRKWFISTTRCLVPKNIPA